MRLGKDQLGPRNAPPNMADAIELGRRLHAACDGQGPMNSLRRLSAVIARWRLRRRAARRLQEILRRESSTARRRPKTWTLHPAERYRDGKEPRRPSHPIHVL